MKPYKITNVLAATDLTDSSIPALRYARLFADRFSATRLIVNYTEPAVYPPDGLGTIAGVYIPLTPEEKARLRDELRLHVAPVMGARPYEAIVTTGQPITEILSLASEVKADVIVMGTRQHRGWRRAVLGSTSEAVIHRSPCPVLTVAGSGQGVALPNAVTNIICPVNLSDVARHALRVGARIAQTFHAGLTIVHVVEPDAVADVTRHEEKIRRWIPPDLRALCAYRELVLRGGPAERILDCADDIGADLLVVGAEHKVFRDATVIGVTAERLLRFASCPVLIVPRGVVPAEEEKEREEELVAAG